MSEVLESPRWQAVGLVIDQNQRDLLAGEFDLLSEIVAWLKSVSLFQATVDERMILEDPTPADLRQHRTWVASLITEGEQLVTEAESQGGLPPGRVKFKLDDVKATVELLRTDQRMWHSGLTPESRAEILAAVFDGKKS
ncbi:hypothetical protein LBMAG56_01740 [Verrucomicrobiota bacterium]|nr:hypothetical protein LBMAG56_01740 [Verrucomicrobiota bacterium]